MQAPRLGKKIYYQYKGGEYKAATGFGVWVWGMGLGLSDMVLLFSPCASLQQPAKGHMDWYHALHSCQPGHPEKLVSGRPSMRNLCFAGANLIHVRLGSVD